MGVLKNSESKIVIISCFCTFLIFCIGFFIFINITFNKVNSLYVKQNIAMVGTIINENPELESKIVPIVTKGEFSKGYNTGLEIMKKYYYTEDIKSLKNPLFKDFYPQFNHRWILGWGLFFIVTMMVILKVMNSIFKNINTMSQIADDIVEGNKYDKNLELKEGDISIFYNKFNNMGERLKNTVVLLKEEKVNLKNIINDISHQFKTPLAALITYNDILKNHSDMRDEEVDRFIELTSQQLDRMEWLIRTLLKYARLESSVVKYNKEVLYLNESVEEAINSVYPLAKEKEQKIIFNCDSNVNYLHDRKWIIEALSNICKNAIEYSEKDKVINICLEETPLSIIISIRDSGRGIAKKEIKNIFKRFHKGSNSINPKSIGIGLAITKKIVEDHGGEISVDSVEGNGSSFYITFLKTII